MKRRFATYRTLRQERRWQMAGGIQHESRFESLQRLVESADVGNRGSLTDCACAESGQINRGQPLNVSSTSE